MDGLDKNNKLIDKILEWFDKENLEYEEKENYYVLPTYCHNLEIDEEVSRKLYLYKNEDTDTPLFTCFTRCHTFNIYQFIQKYYELRNIEYTWRDAYQILHGYTPNSQPIIQKKQHNINMPQPITKIENPLDIELPEYKINEMKMFPWVNKSPWYLEGISEHILTYYGIRYNPYNKQLLIPHKDWRGNTIGYRIRHFDEQQLKYGKYRPLDYNNKTYAHPLSCNLYGIFEGFDLYKGEIYIYEAEKSVLLHADLTGQYNAVAICGSNISTWHQRFLAMLKSQSIIICPDRDYTCWEELYNVLIRYKEQTKILRMFTNVYVLVDMTYKTLLHKNSPIDQTLNDFKALRRINLNEL